MSAFLTSRMLLGIEHCPTCGVDTIPDARNGQCFWCDTVLTTPDRRHMIGNNVKCQECGTVFRLSEKNMNRTFCSKKCRNDTWLRSDAGVAWKATKRARANAKRAYLRSLGLRRTAST